jgi:hypothetical protein
VAVQCESWVENASRLLLGVHRAALKGQSAGAGVLTCPAFALTGFGAAYSGGTAWDSHPLPLSHPGGVS